MSKCETLVATPQLRWAERKCEPAGDNVWVVSILQQYWTDPLGASGQGEWRDVPTSYFHSVHPFTESPVVHCGGD